MPDATRPQRVQLPDFSGRLLSLSDGPEAWSCRGEGDAVLLLGLGPGNPRDLSFLANAPVVYWLDSGRVRKALKEAKSTVEGGAEASTAGLTLPETDLPAHWREVSPRCAVALAPICQCYLYLPGLRLDPDFWGPLMGLLDAARLGVGCAEDRENSGNEVETAPEMAKPFGSEAYNAELVRPCGWGDPASKRGRGAVLLPGSDNQLLHQELRQALEQCGFSPIIQDIPHADHAARGGNPEGRTENGGTQDDFVARWLERLPGGKPAFLLSVNARGLDSEGRIFYFCRALGIRVALWFVDNPWHVLSGVRLPWWREADIFVTDAGFVDSLIRMGAKKVFHLPLATAPHMWLGEDASLQELSGTPLFVGRSAFPEKEKFFAAARVPQDVSDEAEKVLRASAGPSDAPHFFWWQARLGGNLWPGNDVRRLGLGAERCAQANRVRWLLAAGAGKAGALRVVGDDGWKPLLPGVELLPPVDYYTSLPRLYAGSSAVLNVTSLLMPQSLSQRHFDVWACGGLLLSDATAGLDIFPAELTEPMTLRTPEDFSARLEWLRSRPQEALALRRAWRKHLRAAHGYEHRVQRISEVLCC